VPCWSDCFAGDAVVEAGGGVVAHKRWLQAITLLFQAVEKEALVLPFSFVLLLFFCCVSFSICSGLGDVSFQDPTSSVPLFLYPHGPLSFTSHYPSCSVLFFLLSVHFPSPIYGFPGFLSFFGPFSSLWFVPFSLFLFYFSASPLFSPLPPLLRVGVRAVFIGQKGAGASLLPPYLSAWGAGLPGWLASGRG